MQENQRVSVKSAEGPRRTGTILAAEEFSEGIMYLVALPDYPRGIWFFNEKNSPQGIFVEPYRDDND